MELIKLIVNLIDAIVWPSVVAWIACKFLPEIRALVNRVVHDSNEINIFGVNAKFAKAKNELLSLDIEESEKSKLTNILDDLALSEIRDLANNFYSKGLSQRSIAAREVAAIGLGVELDKILGLAKSESPGERIAAAIAIRKHIERDCSVLDNEDLLQTIESGLADQRSRVRYRYVELAAGNSILSDRFKDDLVKMAVDDDNAEVREAITRYLGYY